MKQCRATMKAVPAQPESVVSRYRPSLVGVLGIDFFRICQLTAATIGSGEVAGMPSVKSSTTAMDNAVL